MLEYVAVGDVISGTVVGTEAYYVRLLVHGRRLAAECTCPAAETAPMCKHSVALALQHLDAARRPAIATPLVGFATRGELEAWTGEHRVGFELAVAADVLVPGSATRIPVRGRCDASCACSACATSGRSTARGACSRARTCSSLQSRRCGNDSTSAPPRCAQGSPKKACVAA